MRVLITTGIFPPDIGGPATYVPKIAGALQEAGHQVSVVTLGDASGSDGATYTFEVRRVPRGLPKPRRIARTVAAIRR
ncbi:MAG: glycosyltransferase, partial [Candidatus Binatia bacterium]